MEMINKAQHSLWERQMAVTKDNLQLYDQNKSEMDDHEVENSILNKKSWSLLGSFNPSYLGSRGQSGVQKK
jgi:U3 small nucleolar ribonucleoprotein component